LVEEIMRLGFFVSPSDIWSKIGTADAPRILDVRRREVYDAATGIIPASAWFDPAAADAWMPTLDRSRPLVVACKAGHELS
jgi:hypothetical protein